MKYPRVSTVHGHSLEELKILLCDVIGSSSHRIEIEPELLGGWTNINLRVVLPTGYHILKLPGTLHFNGSTNPFSYEYTIRERVAREGLCPSPLKIGFLPDKKGTPFAMYEHEEGLILPDIKKYADSHKQHLSSALSRLRSISIEKALSIEDAFEYMEVVSEGLSPVESSDLNSLIESALEFREPLSLCYSDAHPWKGELMHGDFQPSNILLQEQRALFLDFESCVQGNPSFDLAYLLIQSPESSLMSNIEGLFLKHERNQIEQNIPLALYSVICWTLKRLIRQQKQDIEKNLLPRHNRSAMFDYASMKLRELESVLRKD